MERREVEEIVELTIARAMPRVVKTTVRETLEQVGVDTRHPDQTRADMVWLRAARKLWIGVIGAVVTAAAVAATVSRYVIH